MSRTINAELLSGVTAEVSVLTHLLEINHSGGVVRLTDAPVDISDQGFTWTALGGAFQIEGINETDDLRGQGVRISLSGVDQTIIAIILANDMRGNEARIWRAHVDDNGAVLGSSLEIFRGFLNDSWTITESRDPDGGGTVDVRTRIVSRLAELNRVRGLRSNVTSHREFLLRGGITPLTDTFFRHVPELVNKRIFWGIPDPRSVSTGGVNTRRPPSGEDAVDG